MTQTPLNSQFTIPTTFVEDFYGKRIFKKSLISTSNAFLGLFWSIQGIKKEKCRKWKPLRNAESCFFRGLINTLRFYRQQNHLFGTLGTRLVVGAERVSWVFIRRRSEWKNIGSEGDLSSFYLEVSWVQRNCQHLLKSPRTQAHLCLWGNKSKMW